MRIFLGICFYVYELREPINIGLAVSWSIYETKKEKKRILSLSLI